MPKPRSNYTIDGSFIPQLPPCETVGDLIDMLENLPRALPLKCGLGEQLQPVWYNVGLEDEHLAIEEHEECMLDTGYDPDDYYDDDEYDEDEDYDPEDRFYIRDYLGDGEDDWDDDFDPYEPYDDGIYDCGFYEDDWD